MIPLLRYSWNDAVRSHRWVAPVLLFIGSDSVLSIPAGGVLPTYGGVAVLVLFLAVWFAIFISNNEDAVQFAVTAVTAGSVTKVRLGKLVVALLGAVTLGVLGLIPPAAITSSHLSVTDFLNAIGAVLATSTAGVAIGSMCVRPILTKASWSVVCGAGGGIATILIPNCPPTRQIMVLFSSSSANVWSGVVLAAAETVVLAVIVIGASLTMAWRKT
ncbi:MAG: hypothetical protein WAM97_11950 [Acidimicrobiales bacterium]